MKVIEKIPAECELRVLDILHKIMGYINSKAGVQPVGNANMTKSGVKIMKKDGQILEYENFGEETVIVKSVEVCIKTSINIFNCNKTTFVIEGKVNTIFVSGCNNCNITLYELVS